MTYSEKLQDPRWQKKRLEILERDNWECQLCGDGTTTFHIHHFKYKGDPWEVSNDDLITYCKYCHSIIEFYKKMDISPIRVLRALNEEVCQFHFLYRDCCNSDLLIDTFWPIDGKVEYRSSISHCTLYWIKDILFANAEAPF